MTDEANEGAQRAGGASMSEGTHMQATILGGVRVVDFSTGVPGPVLPPTAGRRPGA